MPLEILMTLTAIETNDLNEVREVEVRRAKREATNADIRFLTDEAVAAVERGLGVHEVPR